MRLLFLGHACYLIEVDGVRILTDPWLTDPIFEGHVERNPPLDFSIGDLPGIDVIAITHAHLDHFNAPTLAALADKSIPVVHPPIRFTELDRNLSLLGYSRLIERAPFEAFEIGGVRIVPTPSVGVLDECAYIVAGRGGTFWNGADAPQVAEVTAEIAARFGPIDVGAFSHNSFDQPALLGLHSFKPGDHGPRSAAETARLLGVRAAIAGASNLRWRGASAESTTRKVIRRGANEFRTELAARCSTVEFLDLRPGDAWSPADGIERSAVRGAAAVPVAHDYAHAFLRTGARWCSAGRPETEATFQRDLPARTAAAPEASRYVAQTVEFEVEGSDPGAFTVDFTKPGSRPAPGAEAAPFALRVTDSDWKDLFERRINWQVLMMSDRLRVTRFRPGPPPDGLHFVYALQAVFP
jgi:L-ascorbate metabolism protein UlaG (beta-lactamase superfamily)